MTGGMSPVRDLDRLLQDMDINRLRAVVFRDIVRCPSNAFITDHISPLPQRASVGGEQDADIKSEQIV